MKQEKISYSRAELEVVMLSPDDIVRTSDMGNIPDTGDGSWGDWD